MMISPKTHAWTKRLIISVTFLLLAFPAVAMLQAPDHDGASTGLRASVSGAAVPTGPVANMTDKTVTWNTTKCLDGVTFPLDARGPYMMNGSYRGSIYLLFRWTFNDSGLQNLTGYRVTSYFWRHAGVIQVTLNVSHSVTHEYAIDVFNVTVVPEVDAGPDRTLWEGSDKTLVTFNGSADDDKGIVNYTWTLFDYGNKDYYFYTTNWTFNFVRPGQYYVTLNATDSIGMVGGDNLTITIRRIPTFIEENWIIIFIGFPIIAIAVVWLIRKLKRDGALMTPTDIEKVRLQAKNFRKTWKIFRSNRLGFGGFIVLVAFVVMALFSPWISTVPAPNDPDHYEQTILDNNWVNPLPPTLTRSPYGNHYFHPFGTDHQGQDVYSMTMYGARASLEVGLVATFISVMLGAMVGLTAGYFGRIADETLMRTTDFFLVLPWFPLMIVMMAILGRQFIWVIIVIGITSWPSTARVVRAQVLTVKERQFIVRARAVGAGDGHIIKTHILPNVLPIIFANTVLLIANAIFSESFLDFFGLGDPKVISWGGMLEGAYEQSAFLQGAWWWIIAPGAAIVLMVLAFSMVGYAIDDVLNPKLRRR